MPARPTAPKRLVLHKASRELELQFGETSYRLSAEFLRVHSPSAEVQGHGPNQKTVQLNKENVGISAIDPQGNYGIRITFNDHHDTGIFTWALLNDFCHNQETLWQQYLIDAKDEKLKQSGESALKWV